MDEWRKIAFGDLHVQARTLEWALYVLRKVRELALEYDAEVVCNGDFWEQRGVLSVRQVDAIQDELDEHRRAGIQWRLIPGNHDQVSRDGLIHGLRIFAPYSNIKVVTKPVLKDGVAYIPWREDPAKQAKLFSRVPPGTTIFGHGEVKGSLANSGYKVKSYWSPSAVAHARAVYLGHFHKRQQLAPNVWYLGSPMELNFGEAGDPHGVALIRSTEIDPTFINLDEPPKHYRIKFPDTKALKKIRPHDRVEAEIPGDRLDQPDVLNWMQGIPAENVRPVSSSEESVPSTTVAFTMGEALDAYVDENASGRKKALKRIGHEMLDKIEHIAPLGSKVRFKAMQVKGFCMIPGPLQFIFPRKGVTLLTGKNGSGKTSFLDAIAWCLYGVTAPRKPGAHAASISADDVIHDKASEANVRVLVDVDGTKYEIKRVKKRGKGARISVKREGKRWREEGITDTQMLVQAIIGLDYDLWRSCVSLGQGEVASFAIDATKRRTELLERAFRLDACPVAQKRVRANLKEINGALETLDDATLQARAALDEARTTDFAADILEWDRGRDAVIEKGNTALGEVRGKIVGFVKLLGQEEQWTTRRTSLQAKLAGLRAQETGPTHEHIGNLHGQLGAATAEQKTIENALQRETARYGEAQENQACAECGQSLPTEQHEQHLENIEQAIQSKKFELQNATMRVQNLQVALGKLAKASSTPAPTSAITECEQRVGEADRALSAIGKIRVKHDGLVETEATATAEVDRIAKAKNPFVEKQKAHRARLGKLEEQCRELEASGMKVRKKAKLYEFWEQGFGPRGLSTFVLRSVMTELETYANAFLMRVTDGKVFVKVSMADDLEIRCFEMTDEVRERDFKQLSGGERRCVQMAFAPFALAQMTYNRLGVRVFLTAVDELTVHLDAESKPFVCEAVRRIADKSPVVVVDHDPFVQGQFENEKRMLKGAFV